MHKIPGTHFRHPLRLSPPHCMPWGVIALGTATLLGHHSREHPCLPVMQVAYTLALAARQFAGNSVSVFSALLVLQRWQADAYATYYNGGNIPLEALLPLYP